MTMVHTKRRWPGSWLELGLPMLAAAMALPAVAPAAPLVDSPQMSLESAVRYQTEQSIKATGVRVDVHVKEPASRPPALSLDIMLPRGLAAREELPRRAPGEASYVNPYAPPKAAEPAGRTQLDTIRDVVAAATAAWDRLAETSDWRRERIAEMNIYFADDGRYWTTTITGLHALLADPENTFWKLGWRTASNGPPFAEKDYLRFANVDGMTVDVQADADSRPVLILRARSARAGAEQSAIARDTARLARELIKVAVQHGQSVAAAQVYVNEAGLHWDLDDIKWKVDFLNLPDADLLRLAQRIDAASLANNGASRGAPGGQADTALGSADGAAATDLQRRKADLERLEAAIADCKKGVAFLKGDGVAKDPVKANEYFERLANGGDPCGQLFLGMNLYVGNGIAKDEARGLALIRQAAAQGDPVAKQALAEIEGH